MRAMCYNITKERKKSADKYQKITWEGKRMKTLIDSIDALPQVLKLVLALPGIDIVWWIYRICKSLENNNIGGVIVAVLVLIIGVPFMWLVDVITVLMKNTVWWFD